MSYGGLDTVRKLINGRIPASLAGWFATGAEILGLLNKGSARAEAAPSAGEAGNVLPISSNTLNVTRVGGVVALISGAGAAALLIFQVNKTTDRAPIVVAAYLSIGAIVAAALLTTAIIIAADVRARTAVAVTASPTAGATARLQTAAAESVVPPQEWITSLDRAYDYVLANATKANMTLTLPSASSAPCQPMTIKRQDNTTHYLIIRPQGAEQILDGHQYPLAAAESVQIYSDGKNWLAV